MARRAKYYMEIEKQNRNLRGKVEIHIINKKEYCGAVNKLKVSCVEIN